MMACDGILLGIFGSLIRIDFNMVSPIAGHSIERRLGWFRQLNRTASQEMPGNPPVKILAALALLAKSSLVRARQGSAALWYHTWHMYSLSTDKLDDKMAWSLNK